MKETFLEVHVPISPVRFLFNRVRYLARSIRSLGGDYADSRVVVTVGDTSPPFDLDLVMPWARDEGIEWRWVDTNTIARWWSLGTANAYAYTMMDRFRSAFTSEYVIIADADILFLRQFNDLISLVGGDLDVGGTMTHVPPFTSQSHAEMWGRMFAAFDLPPPVMEFEHPGWQDMFFQQEMRYSPAYFNSGMVIGAREAMNRMAPMAIPALKAVRSVENTFFFDQLAFTLMMYKALVNKKLVPLRFNFPNQESFENRFPDEANDAAVIHFLRTERIHRDHIFESEDAIEAFVQRTDLAGSNEKVRSRVETIHRMFVGETSTGVAMEAKADQQLPASPLAGDLLGHRGPSSAAENACDAVSSPDLPSAGWTSVIDVDARRVNVPDNPVLILGFHHSGTRLLAHQLAAMGIFQVMDDGVGEWAFIQRLNERLCPSWCQPASLRSWMNSSHPARIDAREVSTGLLEHGFESGNWGIKDPRLCLTADRWSEAFPKSRTVIIHRDPLAVLGTFPEVYSFYTPEKQRPLDRIDFWADLYKLYYTAIRRHVVRSSECFELRFEDLIQDTPNVLRQLGRFIRTANLDQAVENAIRRETIDILPTRSLEAAIESGRLSLGHIDKILHHTAHIRYELGYAEV